MRHQSLVLTSIVQRLPDFGREDYLNYLRGVKKIIVMLIKHPYSIYFKIDYSIVPVRTGDQAYFPLQGRVKYRKPGVTGYVYFDLSFMLNLR